MPGCCTSPHGTNSTIALAFGIVAFILTQGAVSSCYYFRIEGRLSPIPPYYYEGGGFSNIGLTSFEYYGPTFETSNGVTLSYGLCFPYTWYQLTYVLDGPMLAARGMGITAYASSGICLLTLILMTCFKFPVIILKALAAVELLAAVFLALTFVAVNSVLTSEPYNGKLFVTPWVAIVAMIFCVLTSYFLFQCPPGTDDMDQGGSSPSRPPPPQAYQPGTITVTETVMADGSKKVVKTTTHPDGSQTVEETLTTPI